MSEPNDLVPPSVDILKGSALAMAQATIQNAMDDAGISILTLAHRMHVTLSFAPTPDAR